MGKKFRSFSLKYLAFIRLLHDKKQKTMKITIDQAKESFMIECATTDSVDKVTADAANLHNLRLRSEEDSPVIGLPVFVFPVLQLKASCPMQM